MKNLRFWILDVGLIGALIIACPLAGAQTILLKDGKSVVATKLRRSEGNVMATVQVGTGTGEIGYAVATIAKIDFPEPSQLKTAADLMAQGKAKDALFQIEPLVVYYAPFRDVPGNWWTPAVRVKLEALVALKRDADAAALVDDIVKNAADPEAARAARVLVAASQARKGQYEKAISTCDDVIKSGNDPGTLAQAWVTKGRSHLALKDWDSALLAYLHVPVFYPEQTRLLPQVLLGSAKAYKGMEDLPNAEKTLNELVAQYPASAEATEAKNDLKKLNSQKLQ